MIPPGTHFVSYTPSSTAGGFGPTTGFFVHLRPGEVRAGRRQRKVVAARRRPLCTLEGRPSDARLLAATLLAAGAGAALVRRGGGAAVDA